AQAAAGGQRIKQQRWARPAVIRSYGALTQFIVTQGLQLATLRQGPSGRGRAAYQTAEMARPAVIRRSDPVHSDAGFTTCHIPSDQAAAGGPRIKQQRWARPAVTRRSDPVHSDAGFTTCNSPSGTERPRAGRVSNSRDGHDPR
ncbi:hypothetical protein ABMA28_010754, partial [Loxostege sticticalis]